MEELIQLGQGRAEPQCVCGGALWACGLQLGRTGISRAACGWGSEGAGGACLAWDIRTQRCRNELVSLSELPGSVSGVGVDGGIWR